MSKSEEEIYSTIFTALKHPIRRKILRMLSRRGRSFSEMQEAFKIESSHLTYHLESLGDLLFKTKDGKYALSSFGEATTSMMYHVEETPKTRPMLPSLPLKWKAFFAVLMAGLILSAGLYYVQYQTLSQISAEYDRTKAELEELQNQYNEAKAESEQLQNEYNRTRAELEQLQNDYAEIEADLEQLQNEYIKLQSDYAETKEELTQLQNEYAKIEAEAERLQNLLEQYLGLQIIFVDGSNVGDLLENGSFTHPFDSIQEGVNAAILGELVLVASGTYYEHVTVDKSLTLVGEDRGNTIIDGNGTVSGASMGVVTVTAENVEIRGFTIQHSGGQWHWAFSSGISLQSDNNRIIGNTISNNNYGIILVWDSNNNVISGNIITGNGEWGIHMYGSSHNLILNNKISRNSDGGVWLEGWDNSNNTIRNNFITNNDAGVLITGYIVIGGGATLSVYSGVPPPSNNTIGGNTVSGNSYGIDIEASGGNTVVGNMISTNEFGIKVLPDPYISSGNNTFYHNNFVDNINQASAAGKNTWNNGYPSGGNYWSDYIGVDLYSGPYQNGTGSDGIGDTPYIIDENNTDNYPLMGAWITPEFPSALILPLLMMIILVVVIFRKPFGQRE